jgi:hypothetical protein
MQQAARSHQIHVEAGTPDELFRDPAHDLAV